MGIARHTANRWSQYFKARDRAANIKGTPVPGTGGHHSYRKGHGGGNRIGALTRPNGEWGSRARKLEEHQTGIARRAERDSIQEQLDDMAEPDDDFWNMGLVDEVDHPDTQVDWDQYYDFTADVEEIDHDDEWSNSAEYHDYLNDHDDYRPFYRGDWHDEGHGYGAME